MKNFLKNERVREKLARQTEMQSQPVTSTSSSVVQQGVEQHAAVPTSQAQKPVVMQKPVLPVVTTRSTPAAQTHAVNDDDHWSFLVVSYRVLLCAAAITAVFVAYARMNGKSEKIVEIRKETQEEEAIIATENTENSNHV